MAKIGVFLGNSQEIKKPITDEFIVWELSTQKKNIVPS